MDTALTSTQRGTNLTALAPPWLSSRTNNFDLSACNNLFIPQRPSNPNPRNRARGLHLTHCSTTPNTSRDTSATDNANPQIEPASGSNFSEKPTKPISNPPLPSSNPSFSRGLVFDLGSGSSWDSSEIGSPVVKRFLSDEEERWYLWYHGRTSNGGQPGPDSVGLAVSSNGIHWERGEGPVKSSAEPGMVMSCSQDWWAFDTQGVRPSEVVIMSNSKVRVNNPVYWLYYTGFTSEKVEFFDNSTDFTLQNPENARIGTKSEVFKSLPGLAMSQDGRHWARIEGEHHTGALFDVGSKGEWDSMFIASPQVFFHMSGDLRMYYHSFDAQNGLFAIGMARSRDGIRWVKLGKIIGGGGNGAFDEFGAVNASIVRKKDGKYVMAYEGVAADGGRSIGLAMSNDGLKDWQRVYGGPVFKPSDEGWEDGGVGSPCLVEMGGDEDEWRLYYRGIGRAGRTGIGMAVSEGNEMRSFRRWTGFHL